MEWYEIQVHLPLPLLESAYSYLWPFINGIAVEKQKTDFLIKAYIFSSNPGDLVKKLNNFLKIQAKSYQIQHKPPEAFTAQSVSTDTFVIVPSPASKIPPFGIPILIQRGRSFGIGSQPCTIYCLKALTEIVHRGDIRTILDAGAGTGILAIAASKLGTFDITGVEIVPEAIMEARENVRLNSAEDKVTILHCSVTETKGLYDLILANLYGTLLKEIASLLVERLAPEGWLIIGGMNVEQAETVISAFKYHGLLPYVRLSDEEWCVTALRFKKS
jgi:ribosomal protein L11 methylase PrmA